MLNAIILHPITTGLGPANKFSLNVDGDIAIVKGLYQTRQMKTAGTFAADRECSVEDFLEEVFHYTNTDDDYHSKHRSMCVGDVVIVTDPFTAKGTTWACMPSGWEQFTA